MGDGVHDRGGTGATPRNWLAADQRRRLFWGLMPPALLLFLVAGWVERSLWGPSADSAPRQIDTMIGRGPVTRTIEDAVTIEADPAPAAEAGPDGVGDGDGEPGGGARRVASEEALALVRDDTVFRAADQRAWFEIWEALLGERGASPRRGESVTFAQIYSQPKAFRGRRVRIAGRVRRLQEVPAPANALGIERFWQAWLEPAGGPASPVVVYFLTLPDDVPTGMRVDVPVVVEGVFFKRWAYQASDAIRLAPLLMADAPGRPPRIVAGSGTSPVVGWALATIAALVATTLVTLRVAAGRRKPRSLPVRLDADFAGVAPPDDPREGFRRLDAVADSAGRSSP